MVLPSSDDDDKTKPGRDPNPFVNFRRFADEKLASVFGQISEPFFNKFDEQEQAWRKAQSESWKRFEASYERATNPERRQSERRDPDDPVHAAPAPRYRSLEADADKEKENFSARGPGMAGKTSAEEEREKDNCQWRWHKDGRFHWSWSWGPWGSGAQSGQHRDGELGDRNDRNDDTVQARSHSFGPWSFGPFHISSGSISATFPKDIEQDLKSMLTELESLGRNLEHAERRLTSPPQESQATTPSSYSPLELQHDATIGRRLDWCRAFEDLMAAEKTGQLPAPASAGNESRDPSWLVRMMRRELVDNRSEWHRDLFRMHEPSRSPGAGETADDETDHDQGPETELDYYERQEIANARRSAADVPQTRSRKPDILSTISSVEQVTLPDGSTTIKRTLKRRFADGSEESEDSTEHAPPSKALVHERPAGTVEGAKELSQKGQQQAEPAKGWFW